MGAFMMRMAAGMLLMLTGIAAATPGPGWLSWSFIVVTSTLGWLAMDAYARMERER